MNFLQNYAHTTGRILLSLFFIMDGMIKLQYPTHYAAALGSIGIPGVGPYLDIAAYALIAAEIVGGFMILVGYQTRNAAIALACLYLSSTILLNFSIGNQADFMRFLQTLAIAGGFLVLFAQGAGKLSLDGLAK